MWSEVGGGHIETKGSVVEAWYKDRGDSRWFSALRIADTTWVTLRGIQVEWTSVALYAGSSHEWTKLTRIAQLQVMWLGDGQGVMREICLSAASSWGCSNSAAKSNLDKSYTSN